MKTRLILLFFLLLTACVQAPAQQVYFFQGKAMLVDSLMHHYETEEAIKQITLLAEQRDPNLSKKEQRQYLLELDLLKAALYDRNFEQGKAMPILLDILEKATADKFHKITGQAQLLLAQVKRNANDLAASEKYLDLAQQLIAAHQFEDLYSSYYYQQASSLRLKEDFDGMIENAAKALEYGEKYANAEDVAHAHSMLGGGHGGKGEKQQAIEHYRQAIPHYKSTNNHTFLAMMYRNIAREYFKHGELKESRVYIDSAYLYYETMSYFYKEFLPLLQLDLYVEEGKWDSAFVYLSDFHNLSFYNLQAREASKIKDIAEQYENEQKEAVIKSKNQQMIWIGSLLGVIVIASVMLVRKNREITRKNRIINQQLSELSKTLEQKQVLLSELQHRVKNNLQHVISILEIQKESVDFNNIDELIRGNQNRIHSMALLHKKLNVNDKADVVELDRYITELAGLVKESYDHHHKKISLHVRCDLETISIEKALPVGLIVTELVSNSMKHAFKRQHVGIIRIEITEAEGGIRFYYADNGVGFDFHRTGEKGLGQEIIKGLIDQLDGRIEAAADNGFELSVYFAHR